MAAVSQAKLTEIHIFTHFFCLAASKTDVVVKTIRGCEELIAYLFELVVGVEI